MSTLIEAPAFITDYGLDLPIYDEDTPVISTKQGMKAAASSGINTFVRTCSVIGTDSLRETLEIADNQLNEVADCCGALVVKHQWGLFKPINPLESGVPFIIPRSIVPKGMLLVAEVEAIRNAKRPNIFQERLINDRVIAHNSSRQRQNMPIMADLASRQFVKGTSPAGIKGKWLVDIDPHIA